MSEAYQETREIPSHHILQGNDLLKCNFLMYFLNVIQLKFLSQNLKINQKLGFQDFHTRLRP